MTLLWRVTVGKVAGQGIAQALWALKKIDHGINSGYLTFFLLREKGHAADQQVSIWVFAYSPPYKHR